jgi:pyrimidine operon attenuation protein/uracil phosphoribosyltransferase
MPTMQVIADESRVASHIDSLVDTLGPIMGNGSEWAVVGIRSRGDVLARRLAERLQPQYTGSVDITLYRDDLSEIGPQPVVRTTEIDFTVDNTNILLVDDVLMTGRSARAAIQSLLDFGRPKCIRLLVLVDRGGRELPIAPDYVGLSVGADSEQLVEVRLQPTDPDDCIVLFERPDEVHAEQ